MTVKIVILQFGTLWHYSLNICKKNLPV